MKDLSAERVGNRVVLRWTTPSQTTDGMAIVGGITAEVCREAGPRPPTPAARTAACAPVRRATVVAGPSELMDTLPAPLQSGSAVLLEYAVRLYNAAGRSAGASAPAFAASGPAPAPVESLRATASERGAVIEWRTGIASQDHIDLLRTDLSAPPPAVRKASSAAPQRPGKGKTWSSSEPQPQGKQTSIPRTVHLLAPEVSPVDRGETAGALDATASMGGTYTYTVEHVRAVTVGGHTMEMHSDPSATVTLAMRDSFPPAPPTGLATVSGFTRPDAAAESAPYIDLSWEPNGEIDLAGYLVYRQLARPNGDPEGPLARLTPLPIPAPGYRDVAVRPGQRYSYHVTAIDASGNESAPSVKALDIVKNP